MESKTTPSLPWRVLFPSAGPGLPSNWQMQAGKVESAARMGPPSLLQRNRSDLPAPGAAGAPAAGRAKRELADLLGQVEIVEASGSLDVPIGAIRSDSSTVEPGDVFVCIPGYRAEGGEVRADRHEYIPHALERGAAALVVERQPSCPVPPGVAVVRVRDCWEALAAMSCAYYDHPSRRLLMVGITGTSGKTSTSFFTDSVLRAAGHCTARLGTIEHRIGEQIIPALQTTPEAPELGALLRTALDRGVTAVVMEVSSHALELRRVEGIAYDVAVFTNLSQDHLNFHPDMEHYLRAKARLFEGLAASGKNSVAVVNCDDPQGSYVAQASRGRLLRYGLLPGADVTLENLRREKWGFSFLARMPCGAVHIDLPHAGEFNVLNALAAIATGVALELPLPAIQRGILATPPIPGRFERIDCGQDFLVFVDYAHKPDALQRVLRSARSLTQGLLIAVFGCGGDRDRGKRPLMGEIASRHSDRVIITSDNPRNENPDRIIAEILAGVPAERRHAVHVEPDRREAIRIALAAARPGDTVVIAGKGHEAYQLVAGQRLPFDDRAVVRELLATIRGSSGSAP